MLNTRVLLDEHVLAIGVKTSSYSQTLLGQKIDSIGVVIQNVANGHQVKSLEIQLNNKSDRDIKLALRKFSDFVNDAESYKSLKIISQNPGMDILQLDTYLEKYDIRLPLNYLTDESFRIIWDLSTMQNTYYYIEKNYRFVSHYSANTTALDLAKRNVDIYTHLISRIRNLHKQKLNVLPSSGDIKKVYMHPNLSFQQGATKENNMLAQLSEVDDSKYFVSKNKYALSKKPKSYLLTFHVQVTGNSRQKNGMIAIAATVKNKEKIVEKFTANLQLKPEQVFEERVKKNYWSKHQAELNHILKRSMPVKNEIRNFLLFVESMLNQYGADLEFACDTTSYDVAWLAFYIENYCPQEKNFLVNQYISDRYSQNFVLLESVGYFNVPWQDFNGYFDWNNQFNEPISLGVTLAVADAFDFGKRKYHPLKELIATYHARELRHQRSQMLLLLNSMLFSENNINNIILIYLFVCDFSNDHIHDLQENLDYFDALMKIEKNIDDIFKILNGIKNPYFDLIIGGGASLNRCYDTSHRFHEDCDFEIMRNNKPLPNGIKVIDELNRFKLDISNRLSILPGFKLSHGAFYTWEEKRFFTFNLDYQLKTEKETFDSCIELSFVYYSKNIHLPAKKDLSILLYNKLVNPIIFTADMVDIVSGKLVQFIVDDGVFDAQNITSIKMKNFFDLFILLPDYSENNTQLFEVMQKTIVVTREITREYCPSFSTDPYKKIKEVIELLKSDLFNERSFIAKKYYSFLRSDVTTCSSHKFTDCVNAIINIYSDFLKYGDALNKKMTKSSLLEMKGFGGKLHSGPVNLGSFSRIFPSKISLPRETTKLIPSAMSLLKH